MMIIIISTKIAESKWMKIHISDVCIRYLLLSHCFSPYKVTLEFSLALFFFLLLDVGTLQCRYYSQSVVFSCHDPSWVVFTEVHIHTDYRMEVPILFFFSFFFAIVCVASPSHSYYVGTYQSYHTSYSAFTIILYQCTV